MSSYSSQNANPATSSQTLSSLSPTRNATTSENEDFHQPRRRKLTRKNASIAQKIEVIDYIRSKGVNQSKAAKISDNKWPDYCIKQPIISSWLKQVEKIRELFSQNPEKDVKKSSMLKCLNTNTALERWISQCMSYHMLLTGEILRQKWKDFAALTEEDGAAELKLSNGWLGSIKARTSLKQVKRHGEGQSVSVEQAGHERTRVQAINSHGFQLKDIFNTNETGLFYAMPPSKGLSSRSTTNSVKTSKMRLAYAFTCNANGSERLVPIFIGKAHIPRCFGKKTGKDLDFHYGHDATAWMTSEIFSEWIEDWGVECREKGRKIILLDNFARHACQRTVTKITVEIFVPNMTSNDQPMNAGIIACFKTHHRALFDRRAISRYDSKIPVDPLFVINQLEAMRFAAIAWNKVTEKTVANCFQNTGILLVESSPSITTESIDPQYIIQESINDLGTAGILAPAHRPSVSNLLNPCHEHENALSIISDEAIQEAHLQSLGGTDIEEDLKPHEAPSHDEVIRALDSLNDFLSVRNDSWARSFSMQCHIAEERFGFEVYDFIEVN